MGLTRWRDLAATALVVAVVSYLFVRLSYRYFPPITLWTGLSLLAVAAGEAAWAVSVRRRIRDGHVGVGTGRLHPLLVARTVAVAKASAWAGAVALGGWTGLLAYVLPHRTELRVAAADSKGALVAAASALLLVVAAQWLQHCCRSPEDPPADGAAAPE